MVQNQSAASGELHLTKAKEEIIVNDDVPFCWAMVSSNWQENVATVSLDIMTIDLWEAQCDVSKLLMAVYTKYVVTSFLWFYLRVRETEIKRRLLGLMKFIAPCENTMVKRVKTSSSFLPYVYHPLLILHRNSSDSRLVGISIAQFNINGHLASIVISMHACCRLISVVDNGISTTPCRLSPAFIMQYFYAPPKLPSPVHVLTVVDLAPYIRDIL